MSKRMSWQVGSSAAGMLAAVLILAGCGGTDPSPTAVGGGGAPLRVVATLNVWGSIASQLGGDRVQVDVIDTGADPHDYEPTAGDARAFADADLVIVNGVGYDSWASRLLDAAGDASAGRRVVSVGQLLGVPDDGNPHQWNNPDSVVRVADAVTAQYRALLPAASASFDELHDRLLASGFHDYDAVVATIRTRFAGTPVGASESLLVPLAEGLHLRMLTPAGYLNAEHDEAEPSAADVAATEAQLTGRQVAVWMYDSRSTEPEVLHLNDLAHAAGIPVVAFTEAIPGNGQSFQDWQHDQLQSLLQALQGVR